MSIIETYVRAACLAAGSAAVIVAALAFMPSPAAAQFICDSTTPGGGDGANAGIGAVGCGTNADASGDYSAAFGSSEASGVSSAAFGYGSTASGDNSTAFGIFSEASGSASTTFGREATSSGDNSAAFGAFSNASGANSVAIGSGAQVAGLNAVAVGNNTNANFANSAAVGNGAVTTRANQQAFGTAGNSYTMAGITSAASKAAQTGPTQLVTSDAGGNLATTTLANLGLASTGDINAINTQLASLQSQISVNQDEARAGTALALAASQLNYDMRPGKVSLSAALGFFEGASGIAAGLGYAATDRLRVSAAFSGSPDIEEYGASMGVSMTLN